MEKVRYIWDEIVAVAGVDEDVVEEALQLIEVEYQELDPVLDPEDAIKEGRPRIHEVDNNICMRVFYPFGNVKEAFKEAYYQREDRFVSQAVTHCALEPHAAIANFDYGGNTYPVGLYSNSLACPFCGRLSPQYAFRSDQGN